MALMTIIVDIRPEVEAELARQAAARGRPLEAYAATLLEEAAHAVNPGAASEGNSLVELFAPVRGLFADGELDFNRNPSAGRPVDLS
jgi:hypothetical protein